MNNITTAFIEAKAAPTTKTIETLLESMLQLLEDFENNQININNVMNELKENGIDITESNLFESIEELHITPEELLELDSVDTTTDKYKETKKKVLDEVDKLTT